MSATTTPRKPAQKRRRGTTPTSSSSVPKKRKVAARTPADRLKQHLLVCQRLYQGDTTPVRVREVSEQEKSINVLKEPVRAIHFNQGRLNTVKAGRQAHPVTSVKTQQATTGSSDASEPFEVLVKWGDADAKADEAATFEVDYRRPQLYWRSTCRKYLLFLGW